MRREFLLIVRISTGVHFTVGLSSDTTFGTLLIIKFDKIITNVGGGYIDDVDNTDCGKFIAPGNGTYQFNANLFNGNKAIGADLRVNGRNGIIAASNAGSGTASLNAILDLKQGDKVYLEKPLWVANDTLYDRYFTSFSGFLID